MLIKKLTRQNSLYQHDSKIDNTKYYVRGLYDEFIVTFLRLLEPIELKDGQILQKEGQEKLNEIHFIMSGQLLVGYNHKKFIFEQQLDDFEMPISKDCLKYEEIKTKFVRGMVSSVQD